MLLLLVCCVELAACIYRKQVEECFHPRPICFTGRKKRFQYSFEVVEGIDRIADLKMEIIRPNWQRRRRLIYLTSAFACFVFGLSNNGNNFDNFLTTRILKNEGKQLEFPVQQQPQHRHGRDLIGGHLRYAAFGSGITYGAGLASRFQAFPYLISADVHNYASFSGGPNYPAACTESVVGDDSTYDVIMLDYYLSANYGLPELAQRLRERFPHAIILFMEIWNPLMARRKSKEHETETFRQWLDRMNIDQSDRKPFRKLLRADIDADGVEWFFPERKQDSIILDASRAIHGHHFNLNQVKNDALASLIQYDYLFDDSFQHLSEEGHKTIAKHLQHTISSIRSSLLPNQKGLQDEAAIINKVQKGTWGSGDSCHFWYTDGNVNMNVFDSNDWAIVLYDKHYGKYALEVDEAGYFNITNPFDRERTVYISFLASSEPDEYPPTRFKGLASPQEVDITPISETKTFESGVPKTIALGQIKPGVTEVYVKPLQKAKHYFRLVGISITAEEATVDEYKFAPAFNH